MKNFSLQPSAFSLQPSAAQQLRSSEAKQAFKIKFIALLSISASVLSLTNAEAQNIYDIQFSGIGSYHPYQGSAVIGTNNDFWNYSAQNTTQIDLNNIEDTSQVQSGISFSYNISGATDFLGQSDWGGFYGTQYANLMGGYFYLSAGLTEMMTFTGLSPEQSFTLYLYTQGAGFVGLSDRELYLTPTNDTSTPYGSYQTSEMNGSESNFVAGQNYLEISGTASTSGVVSFNYSGAGGVMEADINGLQLQLNAVPEPSTYALFGIGTLLLITAYRRKSA